MSNQIIMFDLLEELSIEAQELLTGGENTSPLSGPPGTGNQSNPPGTSNQLNLPCNTGRKGATGYIVPDDNPNNYHTWRLDKPF